MNSQMSEKLFSFEHAAHAYRIMDRHVLTILMLKKAGITSLEKKKILDIGCGTGASLLEFLQWGSEPQLLHGLDINSTSVARAKDVLPKSEILLGSGESLPWDDATFDVVSQHTVFTSILEKSSRRCVANEMIRVLKPGGIVLWYDFIFKSPSNPNVSPVTLDEVQELFSGLKHQFQRITLAPPLANKIPECLLPYIYPSLARLPFLCTHLLGIFSKR